ncbi:CAP domain-containing protein [Amylocystis lapponica]|nr:CAP domain-containing protein [Amylocystis lapponica]
MHLQCRHRRGLRSLSSSASITSFSPSASSSFASSGLPFSSSVRPPPFPSSRPKEISQYLSLHNQARASRHAAPLAWSNDLQASAQRWASGCQFAHSNGVLGSVGENLAAGTGTFTPKDAVQQFLSDESSYDPAKPTFSHFTQVVWKSTTQLGCAAATCDNIFPGAGPATYHVCLYNPVGNVVGQEQ